MKNIVNIDFIRFVPPKSAFDLLGFERLVIFSENPSELPDSVLKGYLIRAEDVKELRSKLNRARDDWIVGVMGNLKVMKEAVMRRRVDVLLDFPERELDYVTVKFASEKDVAIEISLSKFLHAEGLRRLRLLEETLDLIRIVRKFDTPFILTSGASNFYEMRPKRQILEFFKLIGADIDRAEYWLNRLIRRYTDPNYIMDGLEIEEDC
jgi:ribonuclease P/MRP protein subunit RPP1